jgi:tRNA A-37 threonylcarbamoyl transferase component Bud32
MNLEHDRTYPSEIDLPLASSFAIGTVLNETYRIVRPLAEGGCGEVYVAAHMRLPGEFAVKVLHSSLARDREQLARFRQEAEITSTLRHPHIVQVFDFNVTDGGVPYLVMELLEGHSLVELVSSWTPLDPRRVANIVEQIADALHAAHERGVVHRDLKPDNVMLLSTNGTQDFVKVLDFGISQASWRKRLTQDDGRVSGTPQYMAPEQACGLREQIDHRSDQFSLAAIAYTLLTGREPFSGDDPIAVLYQVVHQQPPAPVKVVPALGEAVNDVIMRGLAKASDDRFPDVLAFGAALRAAIDATAATEVAAAVDVATSEPTVASVSAAQVVAVMPADVMAAPAEPPVAEAVAWAAPPAEVALSATADLDPALYPPGQETKRLIRRMRQRTRAPLRVGVLAFAAGLGTLAWFHPTTSGPTRNAWQQISRQAHGLIDRAISRSTRP